MFLDYFHTLISHEALLIVFFMITSLFLIILKDLSSISSSLNSLSFNMHKAKWDTINTSFFSCWKHSKIYLFYDREPGSCLYIYICPSWTTSACSIYWIGCLLAWGSPVSSVFLTVGKAAARLWFASCICQDPAK